MSNVRIKYTDILKTIATILTNRFDKKVYDVLEGFPRACFMTDLHISETGTFMADHVVDDMTLTIYYFPEDEYNNTAENLMMQEDLRDLLFVELNGLLPVNDKLSLEMMDYRSAVVDSVLQIQVDMTMNHKIIRDNKELMEELEVKYSQE